MNFGAWYAHITRRVDLHIRDRVQTIMQGLHPSAFRGRGDDFEFLQHYTLGEDITHIDWKASERLEDGFLVRRRREERVLEIWIVADLSASIFTGFSPQGCKQRLLLDIMAVVGRSVLQQQDLLGFISFDHTVRTVLTPFRSEKTFINLLKMIWDFQPTSSKLTSLLPALQYFETHAGTWQQKRRMILVLSDFETQEDWIPTVQRLGATQAIFPVFLEESIPETLLSSVGLLTYRDVETGAHETVDPRAWLSLLNNQKRRDREHLLSQFDASNIEFLFVSRETFFIDILTRFLEKQYF